MTYTNKNTFGSLYATWESIDFTWGGCYFGYKRNNRRYEKSGRIT